MIATKEIYDTTYRCRIYPPSVLIVGSDDAWMQQLKQTLEDNGCNVHCIDAGSDGVIAACQKYFDLVVLDIEYPQDNREAYQELNNKLRLGNTPVILLRAKGDDCQVVNELNLSFPPYHIIKDISVESTLLQIIEQIHYMTYRYG